MLSEIFRMHTRREEIGMLTHSAIITLGMSAGFISRFGFGGMDFGRRPATFAGFRRLGAILFLVEWRILSEAPRDDWV